MGYTQRQALGHLPLSQKGEAMHIEIDGRKFVARKANSQGCRKCAFDSPGDCTLGVLTCNLPLGEIWRETAWSRFKTLYVQEWAAMYPYEEHDTMGR